MAPTEAASSDGDDGSRDDDGSVGSSDEKKENLSDAPMDFHNSDEEEEEAEAEEAEAEAEEEDEAEEEEEEEEADAEENASNTNADEEEEEPPEEQEREDEDKEGSAMQEDPEEPTEEASATAETDKNNAADAEDGATKDVPWHNGNDDDDSAPEKATKTAPPGAEDGLLKKTAAAPSAALEDGRLSTPKAGGPSSVTVAVKVDAAAAGSSVSPAVAAAAAATASAPLPLPSKKQPQPPPDPRKLPPPSWPEVTFDQLVNYPRRALRAQSFFDIQQIRAIKPVTLVCMGIGVPNFPELENDVIVRLALKRTKFQLYHPTDVLATTRQAKPFLQKEILRRCVLHNLSTAGAREEATHHELRCTFVRQKESLLKGVAAVLPKPGGYTIAQCTDWLRANPLPPDERAFVLQCGRQWRQQVREQIKRVEPKTKEILTALEVMAQMEKEEEEAFKTSARAAAARAEAAKMAATPQRAPAPATVPALPTIPTPTHPSVYTMPLPSARSYPTHHPHHHAPPPNPAVANIATNTTGNHLNAAFENYTNYLSASGVSSYSAPAPAPGTAMTYHNQQLAQAVSMNNFQAQAISQYQKQLAALQTQMAASSKGTQFEIKVSKDTFKFNASHFVAYPGFRERLHGHNYRTSVKLIGTDKIGRDGYVLDFGCVKTVTKEVCKELNEYFLVPTLSEVLKITVEDDDGTETTICGDADDHPTPVTKRSKKRKRSKYPGSVTIETEDGQTFVFPRDDCLLLPIAHSTAEELAVYIYGKILEKLDADYLRKRGVSAMEVTVSEAPGQDAVFRNVIPEAVENNGKAPVKFDVAKFITDDPLPPMPCGTDTEAAKRRRIV